MSFDYSRLRGDIMNKSSVPTVAKRLGVSAPTLRKRLRGEAFKTDEILTIAKILGLNTDDPKVMHDYFYDWHTSKEG